MIVGNAHTNKFDGETYKGVNILLGAASIDIFSYSDAIRNAEKRDYDWPKMISVSSILSNETMILPGEPGSDFIGIIPDAPKKRPIQSK
jgi:hypothetical protein